MSVTLPVLSLDSDDYVEVSTGVLIQTVDGEPVRVPGKIAHLLDVVEEAMRLDPSVQQIPLHVSRTPLLSILATLEAHSYCAEGSNQAEWHTPDLQTHSKQEILWNYKNERQTALLEDRVNVREALREVFISEGGSIYDTHEFSGLYASSEYFSAFGRSPKYVACRSAINNEDKFDHLLHRSTVTLGAKVDRQDVLSINMVTDQTPGVWSGLREMIMMYRANAQIYDSTTGKEFMNYLQRNDCRFKPKKGSYATECMYCMDLESASDVAHMWSVIRCASHLCMKKEVVDKFHTKFSQALTELLRVWKRDNVSVEPLLDMFGISKKIDTKSEQPSCMPSASVSMTEDRSCDKDSSQVVFKLVVYQNNGCQYGTENRPSRLATPDERRTWARGSVENRRLVIMQFLQLSGNVDKFAVKATINQPGFPLLELCDLFECAFLQGYSITGSNASKAEVILTEPYFTVIMNLLTSAFVAQRNDVKQQVNVFTALFRPYQRLLWEYRRAELARALDLPTEQVAHFKEAMTLTKFVTWLRAGADLDIPVQSLEELSQPMYSPFQVETRSMEQIRRDQRAKHEAQLVQAKAVKLANKSGVKSANKPKLTPSTVLRPVVAVAVATMSPEARARKDLEVARKALSTFDNRLEPMGCSLRGLGKSAHIAGHNGIALNEQRQVLLHNVQQLENKLTTMHNVSNSRPCISVTEARKEEQRVLLNP